jgi:hypothetical protein
MAISRRNFIATGVGSACAVAATRSALPKGSAPALAAFPR